MRIFFYKLYYKTPTFTRLINILLLVGLMKKSKETISMDGYYFKLNFQSTIIHSIERTPDDTLKAQENYMFKDFFFSFRTSCNTK